MQTRSIPGLLTVLSIITLTVLGLGCDGGDGGGGAQPPAPAGTATVQGTVVAADNSSTALVDALVEVVGTTISTTSGADGGFTLARIPPGTWTVRVTASNSADYGMASAEVTLAAGDTVTIDFAVLPLGVTEPQSIVLDPGQSTVDLNNQIAFRVQILGAGNVQLQGIQPTWVVSGDIGSISRLGVFVARAVGSGQVWAFAGDVSRSANVRVVGPRPPQVTGFSINPQTLPATGGQVFIAASVTDGDGVRVQDVKAEVLGPGSEVQELPMQVGDPGVAVPCEGAADCYLDASFNVTLQVPANDNQPSADGVQAPENYSVRVTARDRSGAAASSDFIDFRVEGIDPPPPTPDL